MTLYLLPNLLGSGLDHTLFLPKSVDAALLEIDGLIAESETEGRRYLKHFVLKKKPHEIPIALLSKKTSDYAFLLEPLLKGEKWGVVSDCGLPCLADPGAALVAYAHHLKIPVVAFPGPSSITQALMLSGLSGQHFFFHGYLAKTPMERESELKQWLKLQKTTHIFIEAPYRNLHTYAACLKVLKPTTLLCIATELTLKEQWIETRSIADWKKQVSPPIGKKPTLFLFYDG